MRNLVLSVFVLAATSVAAVGCGGSDLDEATQKDVAKAVNSVVGGAVSSALSGMGGSSLRGTKQTVRVSGANKITRRGFESSKPTYFAMDSCPAEDSGTGCETSCNDELTVITTSCTVDTEETFVCGEDEYTVSDQEMSMEMDFTEWDIDQTTGAMSGSMSLGLNLAATISGGALEGGKLECEIKITMDMEKLAAGDESGQEFDCDNFSCSYDGSEISCEDMVAQSEENSCGDESGKKSDDASAGETTTETQTDAGGVKEAL